MPRDLPSMLKDAALTALVSAALGIFIVGFRTNSLAAQGLQFDFQLVDLAIAVATIFVGRIGLLLAAAGQRWPALMIGAAPLELPSTFLRWFIVLAGAVIVLRGLWPWASGTIGKAQRSKRGAHLS